MSDVTNKRQVYEGGTTTSLVRGKLMGESSAALFTGVLTGVITTVASVSLAALIFSGDLSQHLGLGITIALLSATLIGFTVSVAGSCRVAIAIPQDRTAPILAIMAASIAASAPSGAPPDQVFKSVAVAIAATTLITGGFLLALGYSRAGGLMRFIPYSVLGGFFAGTGWLLALGGLRVMTGLELTSLGEAAQLLEPALITRWGPGLAIALIILTASPHIGYAIALPLTLLGGAATFYLVMLGNGATVAALGAGGWLVGPLEHGVSTQLLSATLLAPDQIGWSALWEQWDSIGTVLVISSVSILLTVSALEMLSGQDIDVNRELRVAGLANLITGLGGGMVGFHSLGISSLVIKLGVTTRVTGLVAAMVCAGSLLHGAEIIALLPRVVLGGLLLFLGISFLAQWLVGTWGKLPHAEYLVVPLILVVIASVGFIQGVVAGLLAALVLFVLNYSRIQVVRYALSGSQVKSTVERSLDNERFLREHGGQLLLLKLRGYLFFGTATQLTRRVGDRATDSTLAPLRFVLIDFQQVIGIDSSATYAFNRMHSMARQQGFILMLTGMKEDLQKRLHMRELLRDEGSIRSFIDQDHGLEWYEDQLLELHCRRRSRASKGILQHVSDRLRDPTKAESLLDYLEEVSFPKGCELIRQGDEAGDLYFLVEGEVSVYLRSGEGGWIRIRRTGAGTILGELGFYLGTPRSASVMADRPGKAYRLTADALCKMEDEQPDTAAALHRFIADLLAERLLEATQTLKTVMD
jgi:SulP family sulfate permease